MSDLSALQAKAELWLQQQAPAMPPCPPLAPAPFAPCAAPAPEPCVDYATALTILERLQEDAASVRQHLEHMRQLAQDVAAAPMGAHHVKAAAFARHGLAIGGIVRESAMGDLYLMNKEEWMRDKRLRISTTGSGSYIATLPARGLSANCTLTLTDYSEAAASALVCEPLHADNAAERATDLALVVKAAQLAEKGLATQRARLEQGNRTG